MNTHRELGETDPVLMETCLEQLRKENLIVAKNGRDQESVDYRDYVISGDRQGFSGPGESRRRSPPGGNSDPHRKAAEGRDREEAFPASRTAGG